MRASIALLASLGALAGCGGGEEPGQDNPPEETEEAPAAAIPPEEDFEEAGGEVLGVAADWMSAGGGSIWGTFDDTIVRIDPESGRRTEVISLPETGCQATDFAFGAFWTATCTTDGLAKIDPATSKVTHVELPTTGFTDGNGMIASGAGAIWLIADGKGCEACVLLGVDPKSLEVTHEVEIEKGAASVATGLDSVWVSNPKAETVLRVDPDADEVLSETQVEGIPQYLTVSGDSVWVLDQISGNVVRLDAEGEESQVVEADVGGAGGSIAEDGKSVWVRGPLLLVEQIDNETGEILARFGPQSGRGDVAITPEGVWASRFEEQYEDIVRLPPP